MYRYGLVNKENGRVVNVVKWDGDESKWQPPKDCDCIRMDKIDIDDFYDKDTQQLIRKKDHDKPWKQVEVSEPVKTDRELMEEILAKLNS